MSGTDLATREEAELLAEVGALRRRARSTRHAYWFPLVLFGLMTVVATPFYYLPRADRLAHGGLPPMVLLTLGDSGGGYLAWFRLVTLLAGLVATDRWYRRHASRVGLATSPRAFVMVTLIMVPLVMLIPFTPGLPILYYNHFFFDGMFPLVVIGLGLFGLAAAERSWGLLAITIVFLGAAVLGDLWDFQNQIQYSAGFVVRPGLEIFPTFLFPAVILLLAGIGAHEVQRRQEVIRP